MANSLSLLKRRMLENQGERWQLRALDHKGLGYTSTATCDGPAAAQPWRGRSPRRRGSTCTLSTILAERGSSSHHVEAHPDPPGLPTLTMSVSLHNHQRTERFLGPQAAYLLGSGSSRASLGVVVGQGLKQVFSQVSHLLLIFFSTYCPSL